MKTYIAGLTVAAALAFGRPAAVSAQLAAAPLPDAAAELETALAAAAGVRDPVLREIEAIAGPAFVTTVAPYWQALSDVAPALRSLQARREWRRYEALARSTVAVWHELLGFYHDAAREPRLRRRLEIRYPVVLVAGSPQRPGTESPAAAD